MARSTRIAVIGGDGVGPEVIAEAVKVLKTTAAHTAIETTSYHLGARRYARTGEIPDSVLTELAGHDAILLGAAGDLSLPIGIPERGATIKSERTHPSTFEPVHGSAPDIAGKQKADPTVAILSAAMLCDHLGMAAEASRIEQAVAEDLLERQGEWAARSTAEVGDDIAERVSG